MKFIADHDYHIHSLLSLCSADSEQTTGNILKFSKQNKFNKICLTDHFWDETIPGAENVEFYKIQNYNYIKKALPLPYDKDIKFYFGAEIDLDKNMTLGIGEKALDELDFVIIPTTHLHFGEFTINAKDTSVEKRADLYVKRLDGVLEMDLPFHKIGIAHLTCSLMAPENHQAHLDLLDSIPNKVFTELFSKASAKKVGIELNFPIEKYTDQELPTILRPYNIANKCGCKFYLGSDAHHNPGLINAKNRFEKIIHALSITEEDKFLPFGL